MNNTCLPVQVRKGDRYTSGNVIRSIVVQAMSQEPFELDLAIAQYVRVGSEPLPVALHRGAEHIVPVFPHEFHLIYLE